MERSYTDRETQSMDGRSCAMKSKKKVLGTRGVEEGKEGEFKGRGDDWKQTERWGSLLTAFRQARISLRTTKQRRRTGLTQNKTFDVCREENKCG